MAKQEVMISAPHFTERDQVVWVKFQMRMKMEGLDMMDLQLLALVTTSHTRRLAESMLLCHSVPLWTSFTPMRSCNMSTVIQWFSHRTCLFELPFLASAGLSCGRQKCA